MRELRQEVEQLKKTLAEVEQRLAAQEKKEAELPETPAPAATAGEPAPTTKDLQTQVKELDERVSKNEMHTALDRINFTGDLRYQLITLNENIPTHFDGMALQNGSGSHVVLCAKQRRDATSESGGREYFY